jgi:hypothetical protein
VTWTVAAAVSAPADIASISALQNYLNTYSAAYQVYRPINILSRSLTNTTFAITLTLTNFLHLSSSSTITVTKILDNNVPVLTIIGPSYQVIVASAPLSILSAASLSSCGQEIKGVGYVWTVMKSGVAIGVTTTSLDPSRFLLPSYSLSVDSTYTITITATVGSSSTSASVSIYVAHGKVAAAVVGGNTRSVPVEKPLVLDASISSDADVSPKVALALAYQVT